MAMEKYGIDNVEAHRRQELARVNAEIEGLEARRRSAGLNTPLQRELDGLYFERACLLSALPSASTNSPRE